jgi:hypothetical protein
MGERFSRFRAAWGDAMTDPLRGLPIKERRRLGKLATSGQKIADVQDAQRVQELISWQGRLMRRILPLITVGLLFVAIDVLIGRPLWSTGFLIVAYVLAILLGLHVRRRHFQTSRVNGWSEAGDA